MVSKSNKRIIVEKVNPGEPTDGTGIICIHLFVQDPKGCFVEPHVLHPVYKDGVRVKQQLEARPTRGRLVCDPRRNPRPITQGNVTTITSRTDDPRAVTCPKCKASKDYQEMMDSLTEATK